MAAAEHLFDFRSQNQYSKAEFQTRRTGHSTARYNIWSYRTLIRPLRAGFCPIQNGNIDPLRWNLQSMATMRTFPIKSCQKTFKIRLMQKRPILKSWLLLFTENWPALTATENEGHRVTTHAFLRLWTSPLWCGSADIFSISEPLRIPNIQETLKNLATQTMLQPKQHLEAEKWKL